LRRRTSAHHLTDDGTARSHLEIDIEPTPTGWRVRRRFGVEPRGAMKAVSLALWPLLMRRLAQDALERTVANAKEAAEANQA